MTLHDEAPRDIPVHQAMEAVMRELTGISKEGTNTHQGYKFRGIDQVMDALHEPLCNHHVVMLPEYEIVTEEDRETLNADGVAKFSRFVSVQASFTFVGPMGDSLKVSTVGSASDTADKATNKAMAAALKYAVLQTFMVPVGDGDADEKTDEAVSGGQNRRYSGSRSSGGGVLTEPQKKALEKIHDARGLNIADSSMDRWHKKHDQLTKGEASTWLDELNNAVSAGA